MLAIRMQRTGRSGHAQFRVIVQYSQFHPTRGKVVAYLGSYDPHSKEITLDKDLASKYLKNGAQPSDRVAKLLKKEGVKLPDWVKINTPKKRTAKNPQKLRKNRPAEPVKTEPVKEEVVAEAATDEKISANKPEAPTQEPQVQVEAEAEKPAPANAEEVPTEELLTPAVEPEAPVKEVAASKPATK